MFILNAVTTVLSLAGMILCIVGLATISHSEPVIAYVMDSIEIVIYLIAIGLTVLMFRIAYLVKKHVSNSSSGHTDTINLVAA